MTQGEGMEEVKAISPQFESREQELLEGGEI